MTPNVMKGKRVMVTGGAGFIGSHLCDALLQQGVQRLVVVDDFSLGKERNIGAVRRSKKAAVYTQDATDLESVAKILKREDCDVVFNLAVIPLPRSLDEPKVTVDTNVSIATTMCELLRLRRYKTLIHCSSSEAYGTALYVPMDEGHPEKPLTPYAASKIACDNVVLSYCRTFGIEASIARPFNTYGPRQNEGSYAAVVPSTIRRILAGQPPMIQGDGLQTRDYSYVEDVANALVRVYLCENTRGKMINLASGHEVRIGRLIRLIARMMRYRGKIIREPQRPGDVRRHMGDISLAKKLIGYSPSTSLEDGLRKTIEWYKSVSRK